MRTYSISEFIKQYEQISKFCNESFEPVCIGEDTERNLIVISPEFFEKLSADDLGIKFKEAFESIESGNGLTIDEAFEQIANNL